MKKNILKFLGILVFPVSLLTTLGCSFNGNKKDHIIEISKEEELFLIDKIKQLHNQTFSLQIDRINVNNESVITKNAGQKINDIIKSWQKYNIEYKDWLQTPKYHNFIFNEELFYKSSIQATVSYKATYQQVHEAEINFIFYVKEAQDNIKELFDSISSEFEAFLIEKDTQKEQSDQILDNFKKNCLKHWGQENINLLNMNVEWIKESLTEKLIPIIKINLKDSELIKELKIIKVVVNIVKKDFKLKIMQKLKDINSKITIDDFDNDLSENNIKLKINELFFNNFDDIEKKVLKYEFKFEDIKNLSDSELKSRKVSLIINLIDPFNFKEEDKKQFIYTYNFTEENMKLTETLEKIEKKFDELKGNANTIQLHIDPENAKEELAFFMTKAREYVNENLFKGISGDYQKLIKIECGTFQPIPTFKTLMLEIFLKSQKSTKFIKVAFQFSY